MEALNKHKKESVAIDIVYDNITKLEKIADILEVCIDNLYDERVDNCKIIYILEMLSNNIENIKNKYIKIAEM